MTPTITSERLCSGCGTPLTEDGSIDVARLAEAASQRSKTFAMREDREQVEARLALAQMELEATKRHKDALTMPRASRRVGELRDRIEYIDEQLAEMPTTPTPPEGACLECGTPFRGSRLDLRAVEELRVARMRQKSELDALERELDATHRRVEYEQTAAALAEKRAASSRRPTAERAVVAGHLERAEHAQGRIPDIEEAIARVRGDLEGSAPASRSSVRAFVGRKARGEKR